MRESVISRDELTSQTKSSANDEHRVYDITTLPNRPPPLAPPYDHHYKKSTTDFEYNVEDAMDFEKFLQDSRLSHVPETLWVSQDALKYFQVALGRYISSKSMMTEDSLDWNYVKLFFEQFSVISHYVANESLFTSQPQRCISLMTYCISKIKCELQKSLVDQQKREQIMECDNEVAADGNYATSGNLSQDVLLHQERILQTCLKTLRIISRSEPFVSMLGSEPHNMVQLLYRLMKHFTEAYSILIECSAILANVAAIKNIRQDILCDGLLELILYNMKKFIDTPNVQIEFCAALANLALHDNHGKIIVSKKGLSVLCELLAKHGTFVDLYVHIFHTLSNIIKHGVLHVDVDRFRDVLAGSFILHETKLDAVIARNNAIGSLAFSKFDFGYLKHETIRAVLESMQRFDYHAICQITSCFALAHMSYTHNDIVVSIKSKKGLNLILNAMKRFPNHRALQTTACFVLGSSLLREESVRESFINNGGLNLIFSAMSRNYSCGTKPSSAKQVITRLQMDVRRQENDEHNPSTLFSSEVSDSDHDSEFGDDEDPQTTISLGNETGDSANPSTKSLSNKLLLYMFGCVALLNISESDKCFEEMMRLDVINYLFKAAEKSMKIKDLHLVIMNIIYRFLKDNMYVVYQAKMTLKMLCLKALVQKSCVKRLQEKNDTLKTMKNSLVRLSQTISISAIRNFLSSSTSLTESIGSVEQVDSRFTSFSHLLPSDDVQVEENHEIQKKIMEEYRPLLYSQLLRPLNEMKICSVCKIQACFPGFGIGFYELKLPMTCRITRFCSKTCAMQSEPKLVTGEKRFITVVNLDE